MAPHSYVNVVGPHIITKDKAERPADSNDVWGKRRGA
jgi:hypothetical protein